jgi:predicted secreted protein
MSQKVIESNRTDDAEKSVQQRQRQLPSSLVVVLLVMFGAALFVGTYLLLVFVLIECLEDIPTIPAWIPILIVVFDILWVALIKFYPIGHRAKVISKLVVLSVSAGALLAILCVWGLTV